MDGNKIRESAELLQKYQERKEKLRRRMISNIVIYFNDDTENVGIRLDANKADRDLFLEFLNSFFDDKIKKYEDNIKALIK